MSFAHITIDTKKEIVSIKTNDLATAIHEFQFIILTVLNKMETLDEKINTFHLLWSESIKINKLKEILPGDTSIYSGLVELNTEKEHIHIEGMLEDIIYAVALGIRVLCRLEENIYQDGSQIINVIFSALEKTLKE